MFDPNSNNSISSEASRNSLEAAAEAAARINAMLVAQGVLKPSQITGAVSSKQQKSTGTPAEVRTFYCKVPQWASSATNNVIISEIDINNIPAVCRNMLTRNATQDEISKATAVTISTRGRYMPDDVLAKAEPGDRPLYLHLKATSQDSMDKAVAKIQAIIDGKERYKDSSSYSSSGPHLLGSSSAVAGRSSSSMAFLEEKLFIGLEHAPPSFDVRSRLLGPDNSYLQHIQTETGAVVFLRGRNSGFLEPGTGREVCEPMHVFIQHPTTAGLQQAKDLARNLIEMVQEDYAEFQQSLAAMPPRSNLAATIGPSTTTLLAGLPPQNVGLTLVGTSLPSSLSVMPMAAAITAPSPLGFTIGPPAVINPGSAVLLDTTMPPPGVAVGVIPTSVSSFVVDQSVQPPLGQPIVSIAPAPGSLVLTQQPTALASGPIMLSQPVVSGPPDSFVLAPSGSAPNAIVLSHPAGQPIGPFVHQQLVLPAAAQIAVETTPGGGLEEARQAGPVFSQAGGRHIVEPFMLHGLASAAGDVAVPQSVSVVQIASGSQLTVMRPSPPADACAGGPSAIYTVTLPVTSASSSQAKEMSLATHQPATSMAKDTQKTAGPRKRRFTETEEDFGSLLGYQHGPTHLRNTFVVSSTTTVSSATASKSTVGESNLQMNDARLLQETRNVADKQSTDQTSSCQIRLSAYGTPLNNDAAEIREWMRTSDNAGNSSIIPVTQYSAKPHLYDVAMSYFQQQQQTGELNPSTALTVSACHQHGLSSVEAVSQAMLSHSLQAPKDVSSGVMAQTEAAQQLVHRIVQHLAGVAEPSPAAPGVALYASGQPTPFVYQPLYQPQPTADPQSAFAQSFVGSGLGNVQNAFADAVSGSAGVAAQTASVYQQQPSAVSSFIDMVTVPPPPPPPPPPPSSSVYHHQVPNDTSSVSYWMPLA